MNTIQFKTDIDNQDAVEKLRKIVENEPDIKYWHVDILKPEHMLTISGENIKYEEIKKLITHAGFIIKEANS